MTESAARNEETQKSQVDTETTEKFIAEKHIGERIKRLRLKKSMGLVELGKHTGLSASFLSQLETGRVVPTLRNLAYGGSKWGNFIAIDGGIDRRNFLKRIASSFDEKAHETQPHAVFFLKGIGDRAHELVDDLRRIPGDRTFLASGIDQRLIGGLDGSC